jgi:hypothetical protein
MSMEPEMSLPGLRPKIAILLTALAAGATTDPAPAAAEIFFRPFVGYTARRFVVEAEPGLSPREVVAILARRGYRLAEPLAYRDDVIIAIGADPRGRLTRFVLDVDDGEELERRRLHREPPPAPVAARPAPVRKRAVETAARPAPHRERVRPAAAAPVRPAPHKAAAEPPVRPATRSAAPTPSAETLAVPAGKAKAPPAETTKLAPAAPAAPAVPATPPAPSASPPVAEKTAPTSPAAAAAAPEPAPPPAAQWKAPSE